MATIETAGGQEYTFGAQVELRITVRQGGVLTSPAEVTLIMEEPDGTETTRTLGGATVTEESTGIFTTDWTITQVGIHEYRWKTTNPIGAKESYFVALASRVANP